MLFGVDFSGIALSGITCSAARQENGHHYGGTIAIAGERERGLLLRAPRAVPAAVPSVMMTTCALLAALPLARPRQPDRSCASRSAIMFAA